MSNINRVNSNDSNGPFLDLDEEIRLERILEVKFALETIEATVDQNDKVLALIMESEIDKHHQIFKNMTWEGCSAGICPVEVAIREPELSFIEHMKRQDTIIPAEVIIEKNMTMDDINDFLEQYRTPNTSRGDTNLPRSKRWLNWEDPKSDYWKKEEPMNVTWVISSVAALGMIIGCILMFMGYKNLKKQNKEQNAKTRPAERARFID